MLHLAIFGSRNLHGKEAYAKIRDTVLSGNPDVILTAGEPDGICKMARDIAAELCIPLKVFFADNLKHAAGKYHHRSVAVLKECTFCLFIHDGISKGTYNEYVLARQMRVPHEYIVITEEQHNELDWDLNMKTA